MSWIDVQLATRGYGVYHPLRVWACIFSPRHWWFIREHHGLTRQNRAQNTAEFTAVAAGYYDGLE
jgi:hypothetical protein